MSYGKQRVPNARGLVMPDGLGDEQDDVANWTAVDQMIAGTHPDVQLYSNLNPGGVSGEPIDVTGTLTLDPLLHNEKELRCTGTVTITVPEGLGAVFDCIIKCGASGTVSFDPTGATTLNGATATLTRTRANNPVGVVISANATNVLGVSGV